MAGTPCARAAQAQARPALPPEAMVTCGGGQRGGLALGGEEVVRAAGLEGAGVLEVLQGVPDALGGGHDRGGADRPRYPAGGGADGGVVELLFHGRTAFQAVGRAASMSWRRAP